MRAPISTFSRARRLRRAMSLPEVLPWRDLGRGALAAMRFRRQHPIGPFVLDFFCPAARLCVEADGAAQDSSAAQDAARDRWLREAGIEVMRFNARDVLDDRLRPNVLATIAAAAGIAFDVPERPQAPPPPPAVPLPRCAGEDHGCSKMRFPLRATALANGSDRSSVQHSSKACAVGPTRRKRAVSAIVNIAKTMVASAIFGPLRWSRSPTLARFGGAARRLWQGWVIALADIAEGRDVETAVLDIGAAIG